MPPSSSLYRQKDHSQISIEFGDKGQMRDDEGGRTDADKALEEERDSKRNGRVL